jgi:hypothetical protein
MEFAVCKLPCVATETLTNPFTFYANTDEEISLLTPAHLVPDGALEIETGFRGMRIAGVLDFGLIGIVAKISAILAEAHISLFVVSTYNTDYFFVKEENFSRSITLLTANGYSVQ